MSKKDVEEMQYLGTSNYSFPRPFRSKSAHTNGANTPRSLREQGVYTENTYVAQFVDVESQPCDFIYSGLTVHSGTMSLTSGPVYATVPAIVYSEVIPKLLDKWRNSTFSAGVTIGEGRESVMMMIDRFRSIALAAHAIRRGDLRTALRSLATVPKDAKQAARKSIESKQFSGAFLEIFLGWAPLMRDIQALAETVRLDPRQGVIRSSKTRNIPVASWSLVPPDHGLCLVNEQRLHLKVTVTSAPNTWERLGLSDLDSIIWQLVPLSFVADWGLGISDVLASLHAVQVMPVTKCVETAVMKRAARCVVIAGQQYGTYPKYSCLTSGVTRKNELTMTRTVRNSLPPEWAVQAQVPLSLLTKAATWDPDLRKLSLGAALVHQRISAL